MRREHKEQKKARLQKKREGQQEEKTRLEQKREGKEKKEREERRGEERRGEERREKMMLSGKCLGWVQAFLGPHLGPTL